MQKPINKHDVEQMQKGNAVVRLIDIRPAAEFDKQHVTGSVNIPTDQLSGQVGGFGKTDVLVCICTYGKERSYQAAELLSKEGFENTFYLEGGATEWCKE